MTPEQEKKLMDKYPLFISYPRTGSHWVNCLMELYFDRPRLREYRVTFIDLSRKDYMWFHDHDHHLDLKINPNWKVLYLQRNPVDTIYSNLQYNKAEKEKNILKSYKDIDFLEEDVIKEATQYKRHLEKWLINNKESVKTIITYDELKNNFFEEFKKICQYFNKEYSEERANRVREYVTKERLFTAKNRYEVAANSNMNSDCYIKNRERFRKFYELKINKMFNFFYR